MENNTKSNSCIMLACALYTPIDLDSVFDSADLTSSGLELESHITILYAPGVEIDKANLLSDMEIILGKDEFEEFIEQLKEESSLERVTDHFELGLFENDVDVVMLKLKPTSPLYPKLMLLNKSIRSKYGIENEYTTYSPHLTLAYVNSGEGPKYLNSETLKLMLKDSRICFEDITYSYGLSNNYVETNLTTFHAVSRYFRLEELKKINKSEN